MAAGGWHSFDELPPGASKRLGSQRLATDSAVVAIRDDGMLAVFDDELGVIEIRVDGMYRVVVPGGCQSVGAMQYAGPELRVSCGNLQYTARDGVASVTPSPCEDGPFAFSPSGEYLSCLAQDETIVRLVRWPGTLVWSFKGTEQPHRVHATDAGEVIVRDTKGVRLLRAGALAWSLPLVLERSGVGGTPAQLIGWDEQKRELVHLRISDGKQLRRTRLSGADAVTREIAVFPDGTSVFVSVYGIFPGDPPNSAATFRARVEIATGKIVASWRGPDPEWGNAVSSRGTFGASVGVGKVLRVRFDDPRAPADRTVTEDQPSATAVSADGSTLGFITTRDERLALFDVASGKRWANIEAPRFPEAIAFSANGKAVAVAGKHGGFAIHDTRTGREICASDEAAGAKIWWHANRLVAHYPGDNGDDCDEITEGSLTVIDSACKVVKHHSVYGMMQVLDSTSKETTVAIAPWKNECGYSYELVPYRAFRIDNRTGAKVAMPKLDGEWDRRQKAKEAAGKALYSSTAEPTPEEDAIAEDEFTLSADGKTRVTWEQERDSNSNVRLFARCTDVATKATLVRHALPTSAWHGQAVAPDGAWFAVADRGSVLLYPCRTR